MRMYQWDNERLYFRSSNNFYLADLREAAEDLPRKALACLAAKYASSVHLPCDDGTIVMSAASDLAAEQCVETMTGYTVRGAFKWSADADGGSLFFDKV